MQSNIRAHIKVTKANVTIKQYEAIQLNATTNFLSTAVSTKLNIITSAKSGSAGVLCETTVV